MTFRRWDSVALLCLLSGACMDRGTAFSVSKLTARPSSASRYLGRSSPLVGHHRPAPRTRPAMTATAPICSSASSSEGQSSPSQSPRSRLRGLTGFSLTALRATLRAATGFSLTALRTTLRAATGVSLSQTISGTLRRVLEVLHPGLRYFLQPFLILYYAPMLAARYYVAGPSRKYVEESKSGHERVVEGWRRAVEAAERANEGGYWPVHLNDDGTIVTSLPPNSEDVLDLTDGIEKSVAAATAATSEPTMA